MVMGAGGNFTWPVALRALLSFSTASRSEATEKHNEGSGLTRGSQPLAFLKNFYHPMVMVDRR